MLNETDRRILMESSVELARHGHNEHALAIASLLARAQADAQPVGDKGEDEAPFDFHRALQIANGVMEQYKADMPQWWKRMDGTPILNDLPVIMALAFQAECEALQERGIKAEALNRKFADSINGPTHMGEPVIPEDDTSFAPDYKALWAFGMLSNQLEERGENERAAEIRALIDSVTGNAAQDAYSAAQSGQRAGVAEDARDAARYRFIRATTKAVRNDDGSGRTEVTPEEFDAITDAAIAAAPTPAAQGGGSHD